MRPSEDRNDSELVVEDGQVIKSLFNIGFIQIPSQDRSEMGERGMAILDLSDEKGHFIRGQPPMRVGRKFAAALKSTPSREGHSGIGMVTPSPDRFMFQKQDITMLNH